MYCWAVCSDLRLLATSLKFYAEFVLTALGFKPERGTILVLQQTHFLNFQRQVSTLFALIQRSFPDIAHDLEDQGMFCVSLKELFTDPMSL